MTEKIDFPYFVTKGKCEGNIYFKQGIIINQTKYKIDIEAELSLKESNFDITQVHICITPNHSIKKYISVIRKTESFILTLKETLNSEFGSYGPSDYKRKNSYES